MDFWAAQRRARTLTTIYLALFIFLTIIVAAIGEVVMRAFSEEDYNPPYPIVGLGILGLTFLVAGYNYLMYKSQGGSYVAESVGGKLVDPNTSNFTERQLYNIVQEVALAASLPIPSVYLLPSDEINAFAAGLTPKDSAVAITTGALQKLNRDEIQGVIAHEFGHIRNGDMTISLRLAAMVMGFFFVLYIGLRLLESTRFSRRSENEKENPLLLIAVIMMVAGALTWFMGSILKATVSRQREYLADASAVQFTRSTKGIANALKKIGKDDTRDMPRTGDAYAHMYFEDHSSIFATHPPLWKRIAALEGINKKQLENSLNEST